MQKSLDILILNDYASVKGGATQVAVQSAYGLAQKGYNITFVYASGEVDDTLKHNKISCVSLNQFDLLNNPSKINAAKVGLWNKEVARRLSKILSGFDSKTTIVHIHSWVKALSISALTTVMKNNFTMVITLHDYFSVCPNGGYYNYQKQHVCKLKPMSASCLFSNCDARSYQQKLWRFLRQTIYQSVRFSEFALNFIAVSDFSQNFMKPYLSQKARFWRIPNPINIPHFPASKPSISTMFTYVGRISPEKGVLLLTKLKTIPQERLRFIGSGELESTLKAKLPKAEFLGWCDHKTIIDKLDDTRALLFTSQWYETQGLVVLEAAARGVPAIVSNATATQEFINHEKTGLLFESGDVNNLEEQIIKLDTDDNLVEKMGYTAYKNFWENPPTLSEHADNLISCYQAIINCN